VLCLSSIVIKKGFKDKDVQLAFSFIMFNLILHFFYNAVGIPFIFSIHAAFSIIFLLMYGYRESGFRFKRAFLILLTALTIINNVFFITATDDLLHTARPEKEVYLDNKDIR
jgi:hypothetical protein